MIKKAFLFLAIFFVVERFCHWQTGGFALSKMVMGDATTSQPSEMTLSFIGAGKQFYAFETPDHRYVVKFMKFSRRRPLPWLEKLPLPFWKDHYLAERAKRLSHLHKSSKLAFEVLPNETGLVPSFLPPVATLIDKLGIAHTIDLSQTHFVVQKKATLFPAYFDQHPSLAHSLISSYIATITAHCRKGVCNLDPILDRNYGVVNSQLILLDIGSLLAHDKMSSRTGLQREIFLELLPLRQWLQERHPEHLAFFDAQLKKTLLHATNGEQPEEPL